MNSIPARMAHVTDTVGHYAVMWPGTCGTSSMHIAFKPMGSMAEPPPLEDAQRGWAGACRDCGSTDIPWNESASLSSGTSDVYDTPSGKLEPGCLFWEPLRHTEPDGCVYGWTNCDGGHLDAVLPNGHHWGIDSRANNCTLPDDTVHRCWVRTGDPETGMVDVGKGGVTCSAGAGSIQSGDYHGFLHNGQFT